MKSFTKMIFICGAEEKGKGMQEYCEFFAKKKSLGDLATF